MLGAILKKISEKKEEIEDVIRDILLNETEET